MLNVGRCLYGLEKYVSEQDFAGFDPYDALNSPVLRALSFEQKYIRIAWTQFMRRFPVNLRPWLSTSKGHNPKGLGLFLWGYSRLAEVHGKQAYEPSITRLLDLLEDSRSDCTGNAWGYNFDWQSRAVWVPKGTPTIVNSSFIGHALLNTWETCGDQRALDMAVPIKDFVLNDLTRKVDGQTFCFSYTPLDQQVVHNANLLGASLLIRLYQVTGDNALRDTALESLAWSMNRQHEDGSWPYADTSYQQWIDSFHTGFNLQAIRYFLNAGHAEEYRSEYEKGVNYYAKNFFLDDGTPKYYHDRVFPLDIHSPAQAIAFFAEEGEPFNRLTESIVQWLIDNLYDERRGYFYFRKGRSFTNRIPYMRWGQAWAFHALTAFILEQNRLSSAAT